ncbi:hypothetical protein PENTCL1PPCAC_29163 [Pristionchus entomophagus]|uniref:Innexin n=1 Tax=Pristionchus entomophagus TaxID=358040 RepID=A0AAV5UKW8_9BILA|nr:hypothetical protein PENTCL1PPCAC_29163 [Pristionchus entomophagus]
MLGVPFLERAISGWLRPHTLDDPVDRLNYFVTTMILAFFGIMVSAKQYVGSPIQCWTPMEFRGGWEQYAEDYCFIQNTFYIPFEEEIPTGVEEREKAEIGYYQWVPIVLALQAIMFYVPNWIWKTLNKQTGIDVECAVADAQKLRSLPAIARRAEAEKLADYLAEALDMKSERPKCYRFLCFRFGNNLGSYVTTLYILTKIAYLGNLILQIVLLDRFLGSGNIFWGFNTVRDLINGREWHESGMFPRVTLCDFGVRKLANLHRYTVQCVLMINMFNEKIYLFLWFWFMTVLFVTIINFVYCISQLVFARARESSCKNWLSGLNTANDHQSYGDDLLIRRFANFGLQPDGILVMRFIEGHAGAMVAKDLAMVLYKKFAESHKNFSPLINPVSTQSTSPGLEEGPREALYNPEKVAIMQPDYKH